MVMIIICISYIFIFVIQVFQHKNSSYIFYKKYLKNAGHFPFSNDNNGIFHYFQLYNTTENIFVNFNKKFTRIFMTRIYGGYKTNFDFLEEIEHWVYDLCRKGIDDKNIPQEVFSNKTNIIGGACLRYYYNNTNKKYYTIDDKINFIFPYLSNGTGTSELLYLNTIVEKCHNDSFLYDLLGPCGNENDINNYFENLGGIYMQLLERQLVTENYSHPIYQYINGISQSMDPNEVTINNVYLAPYEMEFKTGMIFPETQKLITYIFSQKQKDKLYDTNNNYVVSVFNYWLENTAHVFKGGYNSLYDVLPTIGGILQLSYYIFFSINFLINKFIIMQDSKNLFFQLKNTDTKIEQEEKKNFSLVLKSFKINFEVPEINDQNKIKDFNYKQKFLIVSKTENNFKFKINKIQQINNKTNYFCSKQKKFNIIEKPFKCENINNSISVSKLVLNDNINNSFKIDNINNSCNQKINYTDIKTVLNKKKSKNKKTYLCFLHNLSNFIKEKRQTIKLINLSITLLNQYTSFHHYLISLFNKKSKGGQSFYIINRFRKKLLSEEHLFRNEIFLYYLKKYFDLNESEKIDFTELFNYL